MIHPVRWFRASTITATLTGQATPRTVTSDKDGAFDIPELPVGTYNVTAEATGFKKFLAKDVVVTIGHVNFITVTLTVGGKSDTVTVEANAVQVETTSTQLGAVMSDISVRELASEHAKYLPTASTSAWCAIAIGRGPILWQR